MTQFDTDVFARTTAPTAELRLIRLREVMAICGMARSTIYAAIKKGSFPAPVKLHGRSSAWIKSEVLDWAEACIKARGPRSGSSG